MKIEISEESAHNNKNTINNKHHNLKDVSKDTNLMHYVLL